MPSPALPSADVAFLQSLNSGDFNENTNPFGLADGGHIPLFPEAMQSQASLSSWIAAVSAYIDGLKALVDAAAASAAAGSGTETTAADIRTGTPATYVSPRRAYAAQSEVALTDAATIAWNMANGINFNVSPSVAGRTMGAPTNLVEGKSGLLYVKQGASGVGTITTWNAAFQWVGDVPDWPNVANAEVVISYVVRASGKIALTYGGPIIP